MANIDLKQLEALKNAGLIQEDTYNQALAQNQPNMSQMQVPIEQVANVQPQVVPQPVVSAPVQQPNVIENFGKNLESLRTGLALGKPVESKAQAIDDADLVAKDPSIPLSEKKKAIDFLYNNKQEVDAKRAFEQIGEQAKANRELNKIEETERELAEYNDKATALGLPAISKQEVVEEKLADAQLPSEEEVKVAAAPQRQLNAQIEAQNRNALNDIKNNEEAELAADEEVENARQNQDEDEEMTIGQKLLRALAIGIGAYGAALTKTENPVLKIIEQDYQDKLSRKKLKAEAALADKKLKLEQASQLLKLQEFQTDNAYKIAQIQKIRSEIDRANNETGMRLLASMKSKSGSGITAEELQTLDEDTAKKVVGLPNGNYAIAVNSKLADDLNKYVSETIPATESIKRIKELSKDYTLLNKLNPYDPKRRAIETELVGLVGALRLPFTGPGQLLEKEYERLRNAIGNPNKILTIDSSERAALDAVEKKLNSDIRTKYRQAGINLPNSTMSREEKEIELLAKQNPNTPREKIEEFYRKSRK